MRVVIIGAGKLGYTIAELLSKEQFDVVVVDHDANQLEAVNNTLDVLTINANGASPITISNPEIFFTVSGKKLIPIFKDKEVNLNSILEFYDTNDKQESPTILTKMIVDTLFVTSYYIKVSFVTIDRLYLSSHRITFIIKKVETDKCMFMTNVKILEPCTHKIYLSVKKFWKKIMLNYYNHIECKKKKNKIKE